MGLGQEREARSGAFEALNAQPIGSFDPDSGLWVLVADWECDGPAGLLHLGHGFPSDGASIPRFLWSFVGPRYSEDSMIGALYHDATYAAELCDRALADESLRALLIESGCSALKARLYWLAVRVFGGLCWRRHTADTIAEARRFATLTREE